MSTVRKDVKLIFVRKDVKLRRQYPARGGGVFTLTGLDILLLTSFWKLLQLQSLPSYCEGESPPIHITVITPLLGFTLRAREYLVTDCFSQHQTFAIANRNRNLINPPAVPPNRSTIVLPQSAVQANSRSLIPLSIPPWTPTPPPIPPMSSRKSSTPSPKTPPPIPSKLPPMSLKLPPKSSTLSSKTRPPISSKLPPTSINLYLNLTQPRLVEHLIRIHRDSRPPHLWQLVLTWLCEFLLLLFSTRSLTRVCIRGSASCGTWMQTRFVLQTDIFFASNGHTRARASGKS